MARIEWVEEKGDDGALSGLSSAELVRDADGVMRPKWAITTTRSPDATLYYFDRSPLFVTDVQPVLIPKPLRNDAGEVLYGADGLALTSTTELEHVLHPETGEPQFETVVVADQVPAPSRNLDVIKGLAEAYEDGPTAYAEMHGQRTARHEKEAGDRKRATAIKGLKDIGVWDAIVEEATAKMRDAG